MVARGHDRFQHEEGRQETVALGQVVSESHATRFLATDQDITALHEARDVLESDGRDVEREAVPRADPVDLHAHREALGDLAAPAARADQMADEEREHLVGRHVPAGAAHDAEPVAVPVGRDAQVGAGRAHLGHEPVEVRRDRLRMEPAEQAGRARRGAAGPRPRRPAPAPGRGRRRRRGARRRRCARAAADAGRAATRLRSRSRYRGRRSTDLDRPWRPGGRPPRAAGSGRRGRPPRVPVNSGVAEPPNAPFSLIPLNRAGLWLAVTTRPPAAPSAVTLYETTGVGTGRSASSTAEAAAGEDVGGQLRDRGAS